MTQRSPCLLCYELSAEDGVVVKNKAYLGDLLLRQRLERGLLLSSHDEMRSNGWEYEALEWIKDLSML